MRRHLGLLLLGAATCAVAAMGCADALETGPGGAGGESSQSGGGAAGGEGPTVGAGAAGVGSSTATATASAAASGSGASGGGPSDCTGGLASCGGRCVDLVTDAEHCGECDHACGGHPCHVGVCQTYEVLASGQLDPRGIAVDAASIYWTCQGSGMVMKMPTGGGMPITLASGQSTPNAIAVDASFVYWTNAGDATVMQAPIGGGSPIVLASDGTTGVAVDATSVYWTSIFGKVQKVPIGGGSPVLVADAPYAERLVVQGPWIYFTSSGLGDSEVKRVPVTGGTPEVLGTSSGPSFAPAIAVTATTALWADGDYLLTVPLAGSPQPEIVASAFGLWEVAVDSTSVYWVANGGMYVMRAAQGSIASTTIATTYAEPATELAVDDTWVYWTSYGGGAILRAPK